MFFIVRVPVILFFLTGIMTNACSRCQRSKPSYDDHDLCPQCRIAAGVCKLMFPTLVSPALQYRQELNDTFLAKSVARFRTNLTDKINGSHAKSRRSFRERMRKACVKSL